MTTPRTKAGPLLADRKALLCALQRVGRVVPKNGFRPILQTVRLEASDGALRLSSTDLDVSLTTLVEVEGEIPTCLVSCQELTRRTRAGKADVCSIGLNAKGGRLSLNGGTVEHSLPTMDLAEFPVVPDRSQGPHLTLDGQELRSALTTTLIGTAREPTRYAIDGVLLEADDNGARLARHRRRVARVCTFTRVDAAKAPNAAPGAPAPTDARHPSKSRPAVTGQRSTPTARLLARHQPPAIVTPEE